MRADRQTDRHYEANSRLSEFCQRARRTNYILLPLPRVSFFHIFVALRPSSRSWPIFYGASRPHSDTTHSVGVLFNGDQTDAETHTLITTDIHRCLRRDSNPHSQQRAAADLHISAAPGIILSKICCSTVLST